MNYLGHSALESNATPDITCSDLVPCADLKYDIGSPLMQWKSLYTGDVTTERVKGLIFPTDVQDAINLLYLRQYVTPRTGAFSQSENLDCVFNVVSPAVQVFTIGGNPTPVSGSANLQIQNQAVYNFKYDCTYTGLTTQSSMIAGVNLLLGITSIARVDNLQFTHLANGKPVTITGTIQFVMGAGTSYTTVNTNICVTYYLAGQLTTVSSNGSFVCNTSTSAQFSLYMTGSCIGISPTLTLTRRTGVVNNVYYPL